MSRADPGGITLTAAEARLMLFAIVDVISRRHLERKRLDRGFYALHARLLASCAHATKTCASQPDSSSSEAEELIGSTEAAAILNCTTSWIRSPRFRDKIGGRPIGDRWLFPLQTVVEYAQRKAGQQQ